MAPQEVSARSANFLETVGISTAVGTILGASTLPFYDQPGDHTLNIAYGASAGFVAGLGIWIYQVLAPSSEQASRYHPMIAQTRSPAGHSAWMSMVSIDL